MKINEYKKEYFERNPEQKKLLKRDIAFQTGRMITQARIIAGMTQEELAKKMKTQQPGIARAESGSSLPSLGFLVKMADAMETHLIPPRFASVPEHLNEDFYVPHIKFGRFGWNNVNNVNLLQDAPLHAITASFSIESEGVNVHSQLRPQMALT